MFKRSATLDRKQVIAAAQLAPIRVESVVLEKIEQFDRSHIVPIQPNTTGRR